jgi:hypothetical protein
MRNASNLRLPLRGMLMVLLFQPAMFAWTECYRTPQAAIAGTPSDVQSGSNENGYKVVRTLSDPLLGRTWAMIANCNHPEWAALAFPVFRSSPLYVSKPQTHVPLLPVVVHAGDPVRLWRREALLQIEVAGLSEQNGRVGQTVRVRLSNGNNDSPSAPEEFTGIVEAPADVEMNP